jgi:hypothetical protein
MVRAPQLGADNLVLCSGQSWSVFGHKSIPSVRFVMMAFAGAVVTHSASNQCIKSVDALRLYQSKFDLRSASSASFSFQ